LVIYQVDLRLFRGGEVLVEVPMALALPIRGRRDLFMEPLEICLPLISTIDAYGRALDNI
jgi:hypothetical protein